MNITSVFQKYLEGAAVKLEEDYNGLGSLFLKSLYGNLNKIHQVDTVTGITESCGSVRSRAIQVAHNLKHYGIVENDIILVCSRCHADQTVAVLAILLLGAIVAPVDPEFHHQDSLEIVSQLKPKMCFCDLRTLKQMERIVAETKIICKMVHFGDPQQDAIAFRKLFSNERHFEQFKPIDVEQPRKKVAFILPTQGVTGTPKLVCLSHHFIYNQIMILLQIMNSPKKILSYYPLSWVMQVVLICLCFLVPIVRVLSRPFSERSTCKIIQELEIDHIFLNTDIAIQLVEHVAVKDFNLSCLKNVIVGSLATNPRGIKRLVYQLPKVHFIQIYCTTEVGVVIGSKPEDYEETLEKIGTVGKVVQNCKLRVVNFDTQREVEPETYGELYVYSDCMMLGYFKNMDFTKLSFQNGYFKTGDLTKYDNSGWFYINGRIADLISIEGIKVSPRELEDVIMMHPYVKDTAVISNEKEVVACVITKADTKLDESKLLTFISDRLPIQKWPGRIVFMDEFPTTTLGKIKRNLLREEVLLVKVQRSESTKHC